MPGRSAADHPVLLAIDTAGSRCSAAVTRGGTVLAAERRDLRHGHGEALFPMLGRVMAAAGMAPARLHAVAASVGPGGFTGIRVGLAAAHGIALATGARLIGISSFAAVAAAVENGATGGPRALLVALDSRRADLYVQLFTSGTAAAPQSVMPDRLADYVAPFAAASPLVVAGDAAEAAATALAGKVRVEIACDSAPDALGVAAAALGRLAIGTADAPARPLYLRPPDVTLPKSREIAPAS